MGRRWRGRKVPTASPAAPHSRGGCLLGMGFLPNYSNSLPPSLPPGRGSGSLAGQAFVAGPERELWGSPVGTNSRHPSAVARQQSHRVRKGLDLKFPPSFFPSQITSQEGNRVVGLRRTAQHWTSGRRGASRFGDNGRSGTRDLPGARPSPFRS